jgi:hypothetical protein
LKRTQVAHTKEKQNHVKSTYSCQAPIRYDPRAVRGFWRDVHAPLFASQPDVKRYVRHYVQCFIAGDRPAGPNLGDTDGIVELWFDNIDGFNAFANSPSYLNVIKLDEERFEDPKKSEYFFSEERTIIK